MALGRAVQIQLGSISIDTTDADETLRCAFNVKRDKSRDPDAAEIVIYNLSSATRSQLDGNERIVCSVSAGYRDDDVSQIFFGYLHHVQHAKESVDWVTRVSLADDGEKDRAKLKRIRKTFPKNQAIAQVLKTMVKATGIPEGNMGLFASRARMRGLPLLPRAWHANGEAVGELAVFARSMGWEFSIKEGAFQFLEIGTALLGTGPLISKATGMIGAPTLDADGNVQVKSLLLPDVRPGQAFVVQSEINGSGQYIATAVEHSGDTHGQDWYVTIDGQPLKPGFKPPAGLVIN